MMEKVTVLVSGCDRYSDSWEPFFSLIKTYGGALCDSQFILSTETKSFSNVEGIDLSVVNDNTSKTWSERMINVLKQVKTKYVFLLLEDFFINAPFNAEYFWKAIEYMEQYPEVGAMNLSHSTKQTFTTDEMFFERDFTRLKIVVTAFLYRTDCLKELLREHENIWHYEQYSGIRASKHGIKIMQYNRKYPVIFSYNHNLKNGTAISKGKWLPNTKEFFERHGIIVPYENLGWVESENESKKNPINDLPKSFGEWIRNKKNYLKSIK